MEVAGDAKSRPDKGRSAQSLAGQSDKQNSWKPRKINRFSAATIIAIIAMTEVTLMRSVNVAELKNRLSKYLTFAKGGEEIIIRDRNLPVAKLVPFSPEEGTEEELLLVAAGKMRLPEKPVDLEKELRIPTGKHLGRAGTQALLEDREQSL
ncbi:MAG: type II toxin-antitoxin system prevent-host-death family antitoxin [Candidatus Sulfotelmatobacter sp.]